MLVLGTNVISEGMRRSSAHPGVMSWLRSVSATSVTTVINRAEIQAGIALLPEGARRDRLAVVASKAVSTLGAICLESGASLATRDSTGFSGLGLSLVDPWRP